MDDGFKVMKKKLYDFLFVLAIVLSLFNGIDSSDLPFFIYTFVGNSTYWATYPLLLLSILYFVDSIRAKRISRYKWLLLWLCFYMVAKLFISIHAVISFEFFDDINLDAISGMSRILFDLTKKVVPSCSDYSAWAFCYVVRNAFNSFVGFYSSWFIVYSVALYVYDSSNVYKMLSIGLHVAIGIVCFYEVFEIAHFNGCEWGTSFLEKINPHLYRIATQNGWWPPILPSGIRNVFQEQSYYAYWACMVLPFFLYNVSKKKWYDMGFVAFLMWCMVASNSRTGIALLLGELVVIGVCELLFLGKKQIGIVLVVALVFVVIGVLAVGFLASRYEADNMFGRIELYWDNTMGTLMDKTARSNPARYGIRDAEVETWKEHPLFGVGVELGGYYYIRNFPDYSRSSVSDWIARQQQVGSSPCTFPSLNQYTSSLASGGIVGFLADTMPVVILAFVLFIQVLRERFRKVPDRPSLPYSFVLGSVAVILAFGVSCNFYMMAMPFIVLAIALAFYLKSWNLRNCS